tara:strand:+ start:191 stop:340 length:150 start_codon:yes stop_codon:yes gene_type:complete
VDEDDEADDADVEASDPSARPSSDSLMFGGWVLSLASPLDDAHDAEDDA